MAESVKYLIEKRDPKMNTNTYYILYRIRYIIPLGHLCGTQTKTQHTYHFMSHGVCLPMLIYHYI